ncbi:ornithine cyclodeaminase family protein [Niveispirillum sp. KHB5.9]|uniref:ornithine cyclodeaminase family protein n=1 Tax=Niveispirillum sp. KHB5.9 TaxID=3400269 RepID=UPI003A8738DB
MSLAVLDAAGVEALLPMADAIEAVAGVMTRMALGDVRQPPRSRLDLPGSGRLLGMMPGYIDDPACFGIKVATAFPGNTAAGLSSHRGAVLLFDAVDGAPVGLFDAGAITAIRTAAASAVATRALARPDAGRLALLGTGEQARRHVQAIGLVRPLTHLSVWGRSADKAVAFCRDMRNRHGLSAEPAASVRYAVASANIICTTTSAAEPILSGPWLPAGAHVNIVGASFPQHREVDGELLARGRLYVDHLPSALALGGDIQDALGRGLITNDHIRGELGGVLAGTVPGRTGADQITLYKSVGIVAQDLAVAAYLLAKLQARPAMATRIRM